LGGGKKLKLKLPGRSKLSLPVVQQGQQGGGGGGGS
jgi:hypothetical protein